MAEQKPPDPPGTEDQTADQPADKAADQRADQAAGHAAASWQIPRRRAGDPWEIWIRRAEQLAMGHLPGLPIPAWLRKTRGERRWPITVSVIAAIVLQMLLPARFTEPLPWWLLPGLEVLLLIGLTVSDPIRVERGGNARRFASIVLILLVTAANALSAVLLVRAILTGHAGGSAAPLFGTGASIWATNVIAFALWYWEFDRGGPIHRVQGIERHPDLMFPQMAAPELAPPNWEPHFVDYLYLSFTNATAFSPTDVMPLARWAKLTMLVQSAVSLAVGALVIARAVNILRT